jgi:hypothetical protein
MNSVKNKNLSIAHLIEKVEIIEKNQDAILLILRGDGNGSRGLLSRQQTTEQSLAFVVKVSAYIGTISITTVLGFFWLIFTGQVTLIYP